MADGKPDKPAGSGRAGTLFVIGCAAAFVMIAAAAVYFLSRLI